MPSPYGSGRRCAVLGKPIEHSLSPVLHRAAYDHLGLDWSYERHEITEDGLAPFVDALDPSWRGLSLTMPLKVAALALGAVSSTAELVAAGNTVLLDLDRHRVDNTDVGGLVDAVTAALASSRVPLHRATVLGAGATARSSVVALQRLGVRECTILARTPAKAAPLVDLAESLRLRCVVRPITQAPDRADLLVSTVTAGAIDERADEFARSAEVIFDVVYDPWPTPLAAAAVDHGAVVVSGLDLLVHQGVAQVELMTGLAVPPEVLLSAGRVELRRRSEK
ncbi:shikimate dehydrogenase [Propionibacteriaceae bacterium Y1685]|uniref:shikimate dehydrogenase n=1 Tax=Microlunatus sp. Y1700 TaxID=3418487 RepID=UPI003B7E5BF8